jgi:hypothetical protein
MANNNNAVELIRAVNTVRAGLTVIIDQLYVAGRPDLSEPFAVMLATLAQADYAALRELDVAGKLPVSEYAN